MIPRPSKRSHAHDLVRELERLSAEDAGERERHARDCPCCGRSCDDVGRHLALRHQAVRVA